MFVYYDEGILSYVSSIRKHFGLESSYPSSLKMDKLIASKNPDNIYLLLIDGMGANLIERKLEEDSFSRKNLFAKVQTVFPATTTAATTSIRNGKAPNENAWIAWSQYVKQVKDEVIPFLGSSYYEKGKNYGGRKFFEKIVPVSDTESELCEKNIPARKLFPSFEEDGCESFDEMCNRLIDFSNKNEYRYVYAYWDQYDTYMHEYGPNHKICDAYLKYLDAQLERLAGSLNKNTLLVVVADHGQVEVHKPVNLKGSDYEKYFSRRPCLEGRACGFSIKEEYFDEFSKKFKNEFEDDFVLLNRQQVYDTHLFGDLNNHSMLDDFVTDFIAIAKKDACFYYDEEPFKMVGHHAGICEDELMIPVIVS